MSDFPRTLAALMARSEMVHPDPEHPSLGVSMIPRATVREYVMAVEAREAALLARVEALEAALRDVLANGSARVWASDSAWLRWIKVTQEARALLDQRPVEP